MVFKNYCFRISLENHFGLAIKLSDCNYRGKYDDKHSISFHHIILIRHILFGKRKVSTDERAF